MTNTGQISVSTPKENFEKKSTHKLTWKPNPDLKKSRERKKNDIRPFLCVYIYIYMKDRNLLIRQQLIFGVCLGGGEHQMMPPQVLIHY